MVAVPVTGGRPDAQEPAVARSAGLIGGLTLASRFAGFARILVFTALVGAQALGDIYQSVNTLPNIVFEIVAGGALASVVVPLVAGRLGDRGSVDRIASALLTWAVLLLAVLAIVVAVCARPIVEWLLTSPQHGAPSPAAVAVGERMLLVFAPQLVLYGIGVVLTGVLQAHHRFAGPALAPLLSSLTVIAAYGVFRAAGGTQVLGGLSRTAELILSVGTTLGVVVLSLSLLVPLRRTGVRLRPALRFPPGVSAQARTLVGGGVLAVVGQQVALLVVIKLSRPPAAPDGSLVLYTLAQTLFLLPWAVLAVPVATSAFPRLSASFAAGDLAAYRSSFASAARAVVLLTALGSAALVAGAEPLAWVVPHGGADPGRLAWAIAAFGPGLAGYGLLALVSRAMYAAGAARATAAVTIGGWAVVIAAAVVLALALPPSARAAALAGGQSVGMTVLGAALLVLAARHTGRGSLAGLARTGAVAAVAAVVSAAAGLGIVALVPASGLAGHLAEATAVGITVLVVFALVAVAGDPSDARRIARPLTRRLGGRISRRLAPTEGENP
ncbi:MAG: putative peptidoglycan lipid flippase [Cryptosporangiaceae bacterium]|nr:putative peptidoglycan lipid flippase [Cryptosporangiaceae bacterium]